MELISCILRAILISLSSTIWSLQRHLEGRVCDIVNLKEHLLKYLLDFNANTCFISGGGKGRVKGGREGDREGDREVGREGVCLTTVKMFRKCFYIIKSSSNFLSKGQLDVYFKQVHKFSSKFHNLFSKRRVI